MHHFANFYRLMMLIAIFRIFFVNNYMFSTKFNRWCIYSVTGNIISLTSLRGLIFGRFVQNTAFISYLGARDCLKNLSEFHCYSNICSEFFYQLSQICHNIQLLRVKFMKYYFKWIRRLNNIWSIIIYHNHIIVHIWKKPF